MQNILMFLSSSLQIAFAEANCTKWWDYKGTTLYQMEGKNCYFFVTGDMRIDADGAPNAYHPENKGIDALANAGYPNGGWKNILVTDPDNPGHPFVQITGEFVGFFVSQTALQDGRKEETDPSRYVDSRKVPYFVFPGGTFYDKEGTGGLGDIGIAMNLKTKEKSAFIIADIGPSDAALGEVSISLAENLGGKNVNPRTGSGAPKGQILYVIFPKSRNQTRWPLSNNEINRKADELLASIGGLEIILKNVP